MKYPPPTIQDYTFMQRFLNVQKTHLIFLNLIHFIAKVLFLLAELAYKHPLFVRASPNDY